MICLSCIHTLCGQSERKSVKKEIKVLNHIDIDFAQHKQIKMREGRKNRVRLLYLK